MPILPSAIKKMRQDRLRTSRNQHWRSRVTTALRVFRANPTQTSLQKTASILDRAARRRVIHPNRASRLKQRLSTLVKRNTQRNQKPATP